MTVCGTPGARETNRCTVGLQYALVWIRPSIGVSACQACIETLCLTRVLCTTIKHSFSIRAGNRVKLWKLRNTIHLEVFEAGYTTSQHASVCREDDVDGCPVEYMYS